MSSKDYLAINTDDNLEEESNPFTEASYLASPPPTKTKPTPTVPLAKLHAVIESYQVNGGLDSKWQSECFPPQLKGYLSYTEFEQLVKGMNAVREKYRSTRTDFILLGTVRIIAIMSWRLTPLAVAAGASSFLLPMIPFLARKKSRAVKRHRDLQLAAGAFSGRHPDLRLRFDKSNGSAIIEAHPRPGLARFSVDKDTCMCLIVDPLKFLT